MDAYSIADTEGDLPSLVDRVAAGEPVVITRDGRPVAELSALRAEPSRTTRPVGWHRSPEAAEAWARLEAVRKSLPPSPISSVDLLNAMYEEREEAIWPSTPTPAR